MTDLDALLPRYHFAERHRRLIRAEPDRVWDALTTLTLTDLRFTQPLVWVRGLGGHRAEWNEPLFSNGPVTMLVVHDPWFALGGAVSRPWQRSPSRRPVTNLEEFLTFDEPGWATYLMDFRLHPVPGGTVLSTETRVLCTDSAARRRFAVYWAVIRPFSGLIRREMLAAVGSLAVGSLATKELADLGGPGGRTLVDPGDPVTSRAADQASTSAARPAGRVVAGP